MAPTIAKVNPFLDVLRIELYPSEFTNPETLEQNATQAKFVSNYLIDELRGALPDLDAATKASLTDLEVMILSLGKTSLLSMKPDSNPIELMKQFKEPMIAGAAYLISALNFESIPMTADQAGQLNLKSQLFALNKNQVSFNRELINTLLGVGTELLDAKNRNDGQGMQAALVKLAPYQDELPKIVEDIHNIATIVGGKQYESLITDLQNNMATMVAEKKMPDIKTLSEIVKPFGDWLRPHSRDAQRTLLLLSFVDIAMKMQVARQQAEASKKVGENPEE